MKLEGETMRKINIGLTEEQRRRNGIVESRSVGCLFGIDQDEKISLGRRRTAVPLTTSCGKNTIKR